MCNGTRLFLIIIALFFYIVTNPHFVHVPTEPDPCEDGDVRLVGGPSNREGRVEICMRGIWGGVIGGSFPEASVVCRQLRFDPLGEWIAALAKMVLVYVRIG